MFKYKNYVHFDFRKTSKSIENIIKNPEIVTRHGFFPFLRFDMNLNKYKRSNGNDHKIVIDKVRNIYYASHIDIYIYQYYAAILNDKYNEYATMHGFSDVALAYRNCKNGKCNIDFAKEVFEFIINANKSYIYVGDFSHFFDNLDHKLLKKMIQKVQGTNNLSSDEYAVYKSITKYAYIKLETIKDDKKMSYGELKKLPKLFTNEGFHELKKKKSVHVNTNKYGIPQGSSISAIYANVYMIDFDEIMNRYVSDLGGIYRRYSDDIIAVIPVQSPQQLGKIDEEFTAYVNKNIENLSRVDINPDKTEKYKFLEGKMLDFLGGASTKLQYLGFSFDGYYVAIRESSLQRFYAKAYKKIKRIQLPQFAKGFPAGKRAVYKGFTHLGAKISRSSVGGCHYGNFLTYAYKADKIFSSSIYLESKIRQQVKRHWPRIVKRLKK